MIPTSTSVPPFRTHHNYAPFASGRVTSFMRPPAAKCPKLHCNVRETVDLRSASTNSPGSLAGPTEESSFKCRRVRGIDGRVKVIQEDKGKGEGGVGGGREGGEEAGAGGKREEQGESKDSKHPHHAEPRGDSKVCSIESLPGKDACVSESVASHSSGTCRVPGDVRRPTRTLLRL